MIEIILRDDVSSYETKPLFGFTYRQGAAIAVTAILAYLVFMGLSALGVPIPIIGLVIICIGIIVAACFLIKIQGMYANKRLPILLTYRKRPQTVFTQNAIYVSRNKEVKTKKELKQEAKLKKQALKETEFYTVVGIDEMGLEVGKCVSKKQRLKELRAAGVSVNSPKQTKKQAKKQAKQAGKQAAQQAKQSKKQAKKETKKKSKDN